MCVIASGVKQSHGKKFISSYEIATQARNDTDLGLPHHFVPRNYIH